MRPMLRERTGRARNQARRDPEDDKPSAAFARRGYKFGPLGGGGDDAG